MGHPTGRPQSENRVEPVTFYREKPFTGRFTGRYHIRRFEFVFILVSTNIIRSIIQIYIEIHKRNIVHEASVREYPC